MTEFSDKSTVSTPTTNVFALFLRLFWMLIGNGTLVVCFLALIAEKTKGFSLADLIYGITIPLIISARYLDITRYNGKNSVGEPATLSDWKRSSLILLGGGAAAWLAAHAIAWIM